MRKDCCRSLFLWLFVLSFLVAFLPIFSKNTYAASKEIGTFSDFDSGTSSNIDISATDGAINLQSAGEWNTRNWRSPYLPLSDGTTFTTDGEDTYMLIGRDVRFVKYIPSEDEWKALETSPHMPNSGADMVAFGDDIYVIYGGYQKAFSKYSISQNKWTDLKELPDFVYSGASIQTNGDRIFILKGGNSTDFWEYDKSSEEFSLLNAPPASIYTGADMIFDDSTGPEYIYTPRGYNQTSFYRYDIANNTWSTLANAPQRLYDNGNMTLRNGEIYVLRGSNTSEMYKYTISSDSWSILPNTPSTTRHVGMTYNSTEDLLYVFRGNNSYDWWKYDPGTDEFLGPAEFPSNPGTGSDIIYSGGNLYFLPGRNTYEFYKYEISTDTWTTLDNIPQRINDDVKGIKAGSYIYLLRGSNTTDFFRFDLSTETWSTMAATPSGTRYGGNLVYPGSGNYLYATRGINTNQFWRYDINTNTWETSVSDMPSGLIMGYGSSLLTDGTDIFATTGSGTNKLYKYEISTDTWSYIVNTPFSTYYGTDGVRFGGDLYFISGYYKTDYWAFNLSSQTWRKLVDLPGYYATDIGSYNGGSIELDSDNNKLYVSSGANIRRLLQYTPSAQAFKNTGVWQSPAYDFGFESSWNSINISAQTPSDSSYVVETRSSSDKITWSSWSAVSGSTISSPSAQYLQIKITLSANTTQGETPEVSSLDISYDGDITAPSSPDTFIGKSQQVGGENLTSGNSYKFTNPYFTWSGAADSGVGISGYYVYFGTDNSADPEIEGTFQAESYYTVTNPMSTSVYYLIIKSVDRAGNISAPVTAFTYEYSGVSPPTNLTFDETADFISATTENIDTSSNQIKLESKAGFWEEKTLSNAPSTPHYGAGFAYSESENKLYTFRGVNTNYFYEYDIATDTWSTKASAPSSVYQGGDLVEGPDGYLYGAPGKNTTDFWRYDIANDTWSSVASPPTSIYYGSSMNFDGEKYIYVVIGGNDDLFFRYDTVMDSWESLPTTDFGAPSNQTDNRVYLGADSTYDGSEIIYATQGYMKTGFSSYNIETEQWIVLPNVPVLPYDGAQIEYDSESEAVYYMSGWSNPFIYKFDLATQVWSKVDDAPGIIRAGGSMKNVDGVLYILQGSSNSFWRYNIKKSSWEIPKLGLFGPEFRGQDYRVFNYGAKIVKGSGDYYYLARGIYDSLFVRYDAKTGESLRMADLPVGSYSASALAYSSSENKIYYVSGSYDSGFYSYDISTNTWSEETADPMPITPSTGSELLFDEAQNIYWIRGGNANTFYKYDPTATAGSRWSQMANAPAGFNYGADMVIKDGFIYAQRGANTNYFYRYEIATDTWDDLAVEDLPSGTTVYNDGFLVKGNNGKFISCQAKNTKLCFEYDTSSNSWSSIANSPADIYTGGSAATDGSQMLVIAGTGSNAYNNGLYTYHMEGYEEEGVYTSQTIDLSSTYKFANINLNYTDNQNTTLTVETRSSADDSSYSSWVLASELKALGNSYSYKINSQPQRYLQVRFTLKSSDGVKTNIIDSYAIEYYSDSTAPTNPDVLSAFDSNSQEAPITTSNWYNYETPYFDWEDAEGVGGATDTTTGSGVVGYYVYFGDDETADPETEGVYTTETNYQGSGVADGGTYYLRIKTVDDAQNVSSLVWQPYIYKYDNQLPVNPTTLTADPPGYSAVDSFSFDWNDATDTGSGIAEYCYKTGEPGATESCTTDTEITGIQSYKSGSNTFMVRVKDNAGNFANDYVTISYYFSSTAPGAPQNLSVSPQTNTNNEFGFSWEPPTLYFGAQSGLRYYYSVNAFPNESNVNVVGLQETYLNDGPYATQKGENIFYVVAKDEAGNINYSNYAEVVFTADTSAPGIPKDIDIADVSVKESESWKLAISWEPPNDVGSGISVYKVYASTVEGASCTQNFNDFEYVSSTTGKSYVDTDLEQEIHYYCARACTSTNDCSAPSSTVSLYPDGKWRVPPNLIGEPNIEVNTKKGTATWFTSREGNSFIKYGKASGDYGSEVGSSELTTDHEIEMDGLEPGTTYYYKVFWTDEDGNMGESEEYTFTTEDAPSISNVSFTNVSLYEAYVSFTVKNTTKAIIQYGKTESYGGTVEISTAKNETTYTVKLEDLTDGSIYNVRVEAQDEEGNSYLGDNYTFETLPVPKITALKMQQVEGMPTATFRMLWVTNTRLTSVVTYYPTSNPTLVKDSINLAPAINHQAVIRDLIDETEYTFIVKGKDSAGNQATYTPQVIKTSADLRAPQIENSRVESTIVGVGQDARAQIIISWESDEESTSQIEYGEGASGEYGASTQEDTNLSSDHSVTIPGLSPSKIYHFRIKSKDKSGNLGYSEDIVVITPNSTKGALDLVIEKLSTTFGFLEDYTN